MLDQWRPVQLTEQYRQTCYQNWITRYNRHMNLPLKRLFVQPVFLPVTRWSPIEKSSCTSANRAPQTSLNGNITPSSPNDDTEQPLMLYEILQTSSRTVILGGPGSGKTTSLQFIGLSFTGQSTDIQDIRLELGENRVPIFIRLLDHSKDLAESHLSILDTACRVVRDILQVQLEIARKLVEYWQHDGRLLLLLDGLNEVPASCLMAVRDSIRQYAISPKGENTRLVISSRPAGFAPLDRSMFTFSLQPLTETDQKTAYLTYWLTILHPDQKQDITQSQAGFIIKEMNEQPALWQARENPCLLRLAAETYDSKRIAAPRNRAELIEHWLARNSNQTDPDDIKPSNEWMAVFEDKLHGTQHRPARTANQEQNTFGFLNKPQQHNSLQPEFCQNPIQEYLMARYLARQWQKDSISSWEHIKHILHQPQWREILLMASILPEAEISKMLCSRVLQAGSARESVIYRDLELTFSMMAEGAILPVNEAEKCHQKICQDLLDSSLSTEQKVLLIKNITRPVPLAAGVFLDILKIYQTRPAAINKKEYERAEIIQQTCYALGFIREKNAVQPLAALLDDSNWTIRKAAAEALGRLQSDRAIQPLMRLLEDKNEKVRYAAAASLGKIPGSSVLDQMIRQIISRNTPEDLRFWTAIAIQHIQHESAISSLNNLLQHTNWLLRFAATGALGNFQKTDIIQTLISMLLDDDADVRRSAAISLAKIRDPLLLRELVNDLKNQTLDIRRSAAVFLGEINTPVTVKIEIALLSDENWYVRCMAAESLGQMQAEEAVPYLINLLQEDEIRRPAAEALGNIRDRSAVKPLLSLLNNEKESVRLATAIALSKIQDPFAVKNLIAFSKEKPADTKSPTPELLEHTGRTASVNALREMLKHENWFIRASAALALGQVQDTASLPALLELQFDEHWYVRFSLASALGSINHASCMLPIIHLMKDRNMFVRYSAEGALNEMHNEAAIPFLINALSDKDDEISRLAACALETLQHTDTIKPLLSLLIEHPAHNSIRYSAVRALAHIQSPEMIAPLLDLLNDEDRYVRHLAARATTITIPFHDLVNWFRSHPNRLRQLQPRGIALLCNSGVFYALKIELEGDF